MHTQLIDTVDGFISDTNVTWTFTFSDLEPLTVYEIYVLGLSDGTAGNVVHIAGNDDPFAVTDGPIDFTQTLAANELYVNGDLGDVNRQLVDSTVTIMSTEDGTIDITVLNEVGMEASIAGLAIREATLGSIQGIKSDDSGIGPNHTGAANGIVDMGEVGLPDWTIYLDQNNNGQLDFVTAKDHVATTVSADIPQVLLDGTSVKSVLNFSGSGSINDIDVSLDITHTYDADLTVYLISPLGTRVKLFANVGLFGDNFTGTIFDDSGPTSITAGSPPFTGRFRPQEPLSRFIDEDPLGEWTLELTDAASNDTGVLPAWSVTINYTDTPVVTNTVDSVNVPVAILDLTTVTSQIVVPQGGTIRDVNLTFDATHTWDADVNMYLISPAGTKVLMFASIGGGNDNFTNTTLDDEAAAVISTAALHLSRVHLNRCKALSLFDGQDAKGVWTLEITDTFGADQGTLNSWSLTLTTKDPIRYLEPYTTTAADGTYEFADLPPGVYYVLEQFSQEQIDDGWKQVSALAQPGHGKDRRNVKAIDFGNWIPTVQPASISGQKFNDVNADGVKDAGEAGLPRAGSSTSMRTPTACETLRPHRPCSIPPMCPSKSSISRRRRRR